MKYTCINIQGNLISEDSLKKIEEGKADGQLPKDFGVDSASGLRSEIEYAWSRVKLDWQHFYDRCQNLPPNDPYGTTLARRWMNNFLNALHFDLSPQRSALKGDNEQTYTISHIAENLASLPVQITGFVTEGNSAKNSLDVKSSGGSSRLSPHGTVQEYLNVTEHLYGIASNGFTLRLIRDSGRLVKLTYLEIDLRRLLEEDKYSEFSVIYRLLHASRFPKSKEEADQCLLEKYYQDSIETGNRIRDGLSMAVKESLLALGKGFLTHENNTALRHELQTGKLSTKDFYRQLLRLIYRLLFLMVTEERDLVYDPEESSSTILRKKRIYLQFYSIARLRKLSQNRYLFEPQFTDLWQGLVQSFHLFEEGGQGKKLGIKPLAGDLFNTDAIKDLAACLVSNQLLLECIRNLNEFQDENKNLVSINYRSLDVEELGSVYEGLLELHPVIENIETRNPSHVNFTFHEGTDRKTTGSYYTRPELVNELIKSALIPVIEERLKEATSSNAKASKDQLREGKEKALLSLKVCDAAAGSGHMILAAARTIAWYLAQVRSGEDNPAPSVFRTCLREVIQHCIYAVDYNPDAVELCKLSLWLESHNSGKPLSFLDHKIRNGNSLVGVTNLDMLKEGIPDKAFNPVTGDDPLIARELKKVNSQYKITKQSTLDFEQTASSEMIGFSKAYHELENIRQDDVDSVNKAREKFNQIRKDNKWWHDWTACNLWTAAFFFDYTEENKKASITSERLQKYISQPGSAYGPMTGKATGMSLANKFFHWPLEFPDVFEQGGFDVILGNPPWERIKLQQQEFFATRDAKIANAANAAERNRMIAALPKKNPELYAEYEDALHLAEATGKFLREGGRCVLTAVGDINTYSVFAELYSSILSKKGNSGFIVPTGIATDDSNKAFFGAMVEKNRIVSLFDFENKEAIFPAVHRSYKFCLLTLSGSGIGNKKAKFGFFLTRVEHLQDKLRVFGLTKEDFLRLNPNTKTCPVFRTSVDAELTTNIYKRVPVLINEQTGENPWGVSFMRMFDMSNDSHLFRTRVQLEGEGFHLWGNRMKKGKEVWLPLYEAKLIQQFNHRFASFKKATIRNESLCLQIEELEKNELTIIAWYYIEKKEILFRTKDFQPKYLLGYRDIARSTDERTSIFCILPLSATTGINLTFIINSGIKKSLFLSMWNSLVFDFVVRQKVGGTHMSQNYTRQFAILLPEDFDTEIQKNIVCKSIELTYTSWDIKEYADDVWKEADQDLKSELKKQWQLNAEEMGEQTQNSPQWCEIDIEGCPFPPFKWDEDRRAVLKAELDAIYAKLYGLTTEELRYILDPQDVYGPDFPGETFRVLKDKDIRLFGEYRTKRLVLEAWDRLEKGELV